jgi:hypothetical protein
MILIVTLILILLLYYYFKGNCNNNCNFINESKEITEKTSQNITRNVNTSVAKIKKSVSFAI